MIDLSPPHLAIVERILAEHVPECEVRAFGSRATWNAKDYSDLDLAIIGDVTLPRGSVARLKEAFEESRLPMRVDVVDWLAIATGFARQSSRTAWWCSRQRRPPVGGAKRRLASSRPSLRQVPPCEQAHSFGSGSRAWLQWRCWASRFRFDRWANGHHRT